MRELIVFSVGAFAGMWAGMWLGILAFKWCVEDGKLSRDHMEKLLRMWRGPGGETW